MLPPLLLTTQDTTPAASDHEKSPAIIMTTMNTLPRDSVASNETTSSRPPNAHNDSEEELNRCPVIGISHRATFNDENGELVHGPPPLHFEWSPKILVTYILFLMFCNLAIPCILFYSIRIYAHKISLQTNIGISSASLGLSSCFDAPFRLYKLTRYRPLYGPLHDEIWWHGDFFMWTYTFALFCFAFPLAIAPALTPMAIDFFLMSTVLLVQPFGLVLFFTILPPVRRRGWSAILGERLGSWIWTSSERPGSTIKPGIFYLMEDLGSVDFREGRVWRESCFERYAHSPPFRTLMHTLTLYFIFMTLVYTGTTAAVTWTAPLNFAFAYVLGNLFIWAFVTAIGCYLLVKRGLHIEKCYWVRKGWKGWDDLLDPATFDENGGGSGRVSRILERLSIVGMRQDNETSIPRFVGQEGGTGAGMTERRGRAPMHRARSDDAVHTLGVIESRRSEGRSRARSDVGLSPQRRDHDQREKVNGGTLNQKGQDALGRDTVSASSAGETAVTEKRSDIV